MSRLRRARIIRLERNVPTGLEARLRSSRARGKNENTPNDSQPARVS